MSARGRLQPSPVGLFAGHADRRIVAALAKKAALATVSASALMIALTASQTARAAEDAQMAAAAAPEEIAEVVVTGSRIVRDGYEAPTPVTVASVEQLQQSGQPNVALYLQQLPAFGSEGSGSKSAANAIGSGRQGEDNLNLRSLGAVRTLTLLDGHRVVSPSTVGTVDTNVLPTNLISRIDVVTGGASAAYGSDALAGVVNFVLDKEFVGFKFDGGGGITTYGDNFTKKFQAAYGTGFANDRGHYLFSGELADDPGLFPSGRRAWNKNTHKILPNPAYTATNGQPQFLVADQVGFITEAPGGIITSTGPLKGITFSQDGSPFQFVYPALVGGGYASGGNAPYLDPVQYHQSLAQKQYRYNIFNRLSYDITDNINVYAQLIYNYSTTYGQSKLDDAEANVPIFADNPYMPASVRDRMVALGITQVMMGTFNFDLPVAASLNYRRVWSYSGGATGAFEAFGKEWSWDVHAQYGLAKSSINGLVMNNVNFRNANNAVRASNGAIVCRSTLTNPTDGCVPWNIFGWGNNTQAAINYSKGVSMLRMDTTQNTYEANIEGKPFAIWAGDVSMAAGIAHRKEAVDSWSDALSQQRVFSSGNYFPTKGSYTVTEGFVEAVVPLAVDMPWARSLDLNGAVRATDYSTSGYVTTWKAGMTYSPIDDVRFRVTRSRDIRAPNLENLFSLGNGGSTGGLLDPFNGNRVNPVIQGSNSGNLLLQPEKADTTGLGVVFTPTFVQGFKASFDYYEIDIAGAIGTVGSQETLLRCHAGQVDLCPNIIRAVPGDNTSVVTIIFSRPFNLSNQIQKGFDIEASYQLPVETIIPSWSGDLNLRALATHVISSTSDDGRTPVQDNAGNNTGANPLDWRLNLTATYTNENYTFGVTGRYLSSGTYGPTYLGCASGCPTSTSNLRTINYNHISAKFYTDLNLAYNFMSRADSAADGQLYLTIQNAANVKPATVANISPSTAMSTNPLLYDILGRTFRAGVRFRM